MAQMHFLVQSITRDVPIMRPNDRLKIKSSSIALQEQKELFLLPTVRVSNLLESDIDVLLTETGILMYFFLSSFLFDFESNCGIAS